MHGPQRDEGFWIGLFEYAVSIAVVIGIIAVAWIAYVALFVAFGSKP
jgi:hypothetical protein